MGLRGLPVLELGSNKVVGMITRQNLLGEVINVALKQSAGEVDKHGSNDSEFTIDTTTNEVPQMDARRDSKIEEDVDGMELRASNSGPAHVPLNL